MRTVKNTCSVILSGPVAASLSASEGKRSADARNYSPHATSPRATNVCSGDSHPHTGLSLDAGLFGNTVGLEDAYRLPRGLEIPDQAELVGQQGMYPPPIWCSRC